MLALPNNKHLSPLECFDFRTFTNNYKAIKNNIISTIIFISRLVTIFS